MYHYHQLEQIIDKKFKITKNEEILYESHAFEGDHYYEINDYLVWCEGLTDAEKNLMAILIEHNMSSTPLWHRLIKGQDYDISEIPKAYINTASITLWLLKGKKISQDFQLIEALFISSKVIEISTNQLLVFVLDEEEIVAEAFSQHYEAELMKSVDIIIGPQVVELSDLKRAYQSILLMEQKIVNKHILKYQDVLLENLIATIDRNILGDLESDYVKMYPINQLNPELLDTINSFFEYDLNITDTANALFLHRNTLIYRLNKILSLTKLDIRKFEDANKMKILLTIHD